MKWEVRKNEEEENDLVVLSRPPTMRHICARKDRKRDSRKNIILNEIVKKLDQNHKKRIVEVEVDDDEWFLGAVLRMERGLVMELRRIGVDWGFNRII